MFIMLRPARGGPAVRVLGGRGGAAGQEVGLWGPSQMHGE